MPALGVAGPRSAWLAKVHQLQGALPSFHTFQSRHRLLPLLVSLSEAKTTDPGVRRHFAPAETVAASELTPPGLDRNEWSPLRDWFSVSRLSPATKETTDSRCSRLTATPAFGDFPRHGTPRTVPKDSLWAADPVAGQGGGGREWLHSV